MTFALGGETLPRPGTGRFGRLIPWLPVAAWTLLIYLTLPYGPDAVRWLTERLNQWLERTDSYQLIGHAAAALLGVIAFLLWRALRKRVRRARPARWGLFASIAAVYAYFLMTMDVPTEKVHFLEYGFLGWLLYRAFRRNCSDASLYGAALGVGFVLGTGDEYIQHLLPTRSGEIRDTLWNGLSVGLVQVLIGAVWRPEEVVAKLPAASLRRLLLWAWITLAGVTLFLSASGLSGAKVVDKEIGVFLTRTAGGRELMQIDRENAQAYAGILEAETDATYSRFLQTYPEDVFPFLNEMRVHLFRRDRYLGSFFHSLVRDEVITGGDGAATFRRLMADPLAGKILRESWLPHYMGRWHDEQDGPLDWSGEVGRSYIEKVRREVGDAEKPAGLRSSQEKYLWVGLREYQILEKYFGETLRRTHFFLDPACTAEWFEPIPPNLKAKPYHSKVASGIVTPFTLSLLWGLVAVVAALFILLRVRTAT